MFKYCTTVKPANCEYWNVMATASSTLTSVQSAATSIQSEHRQSSRKRKQNMPSSAAHNSIAVTPVLAVHDGHVITSSSVVHNGLPVTPSPTAHNGLPVTPSSTAHTGLPVTPSSTAHTGLPVTPSSTAHNGLPVTPSSTAHTGLPVTPSSTAHNGLPVTPSSTAHTGLSATPSSVAFSSSAAHNGLAATSSSVSQNGFSRTPSSTAGQASQGIIPQINTKNLKASISAVVSFNFPEHIVEQCAEDMLKQGKLLTASTLLQECESFYSPEGEQFCSYAERASSNSNSDNDGLYNSFIGATSLPAGLNEGPLTQSATENYGLIPGGSHTASSTDTNGEILGESRSDSAGSMVANETLDPSVSAQSTEQHQDDEDAVDGHLPTLSRGTGFGLDDCIQADNADSSAEVSQNITSQISSPGLLNTSSSAHRGLYNGLSRPVIDISFSDNAGLDSGLTGQQQRYSGSGISSDISGSACSFTPSSLSGLEHSGVLSTNNMGQEAAAPARRGSTASARHSPEKVTEHMSTCFKLIEREHELLEKSRKCSQCFEKPREVTFLPCGHFTVCHQCADPLYVCPSCNKSILATVDTYLS